MKVIKFGPHLFRYGGGRRRGRMLIVLGGYVARVVVGSCMHSDQDSNDGSLESSHCTFFAALLTWICVLLKIEM